MDLEDQLQAAERHAAAGEIDAADAACREILAAQADQPDALYLMGLLTNQRGRPAEALACLERAVAADPEASVFHAGVGALRLVLGRTVEAIESFEAAVRL